MSDRTTIPAPVTAVVEAADSWLPALMHRVEQRLSEHVTEGAGTLGAEAERTLRAGGKRMRPLLVLLCAGPGAGEESVRAAVAVELVHMATLVHDDVLDDAPLRRGLPTVYATAGRERAVATGDLLLAKAFTELSLTSRRQVALLSRAAVALARGELLQRQDAFDLSITPERYQHRCELKTATLFECACVIGRPRDEPALTLFGREIGLAFQLLDDVLDVSGPTERTGKARGTDLLDGTVTLPLILAMERDPELRSLDLRGLDAAAAERACERIAATGVLEQVRDEARTRVEAAKAAARDGVDEGEARLLSLVADGVVERNA